MFPWLRRYVVALTAEDVSFLSEEARFICQNITDLSLKKSWFGKIRNLIDKFPFLKNDLKDSCSEVENSDFSVSIPMSTLDYLRSYFSQFLNEKSLNKREIQVSPTKPVKEEENPIKEETWYVMMHGKYGYVLGKLMADYPSRFVVDIYKDGSLLKAGWSVAKSDKRTVQEIHREVKPEEQRNLVESAVSSWMQDLLEEATILKKKLKKRVFLANSYNYGVRPCVVIGEDAENYHLAIYENGVCVHPDWVLNRSNKRQIIRKDI